MDIRIPSETTEKIDVFVDWCLEKLPDPTTFLTLTYEEEVHPDRALNNLKWLIDRLNSDALGDNYKRRVKHSYFSYIFVLEYQKRGVAHWHGITNSWINYKLVHKLWNSSCGFAWVENVNHPKNFRSGGSGEGAYRYIAKYLCKKGDVENLQFFFSGKIWEKSVSGLVEKTTPLPSADVKGERSELVHP